MKNDSSQEEVADGVPGSSNKTLGPRSVALRWTRKRPHRRGPRLRW